MAAWTDKQVEGIVGRLLQVGVSIAALVVLVGGVYFLFQNAGKTADHHQFQGEAESLKNPWQIAEKAGEFRSRAIIQLGLVLLIATPVARVALTVFAFLRQRDRIFVAVTLIVLTILVYSLLSGYLGL